MWVVRVWVLVLFRCGSMLKVIRWWCFGLKVNLVMVELWMCRFSLM